MQEVRKYNSIVLTILEIDCENVLKIDEANNLLKRDVLEKLTHFFDRNNKEELAILRIKLIDYEEFEKLKTRIVNKESTIEIIKNKIIDDWVSKKESIIDDRNIHATTFYFRYYNNIAKDVVYDHIRNVIKLDYKEIIDGFNDELKKNGLEIYLSN